MKLSKDDSLKIKDPGAPMINQLKAINAKGVIYELPKDKTYLLNSPEVKKDIEDLVAALHNTSIQVILDLTPNVVIAQEDTLLKSAWEDKTKRSAFIWAERAQPPSSGNWKEVRAQNYVLSQSGTPYIDLQLSDENAKNYFKDVLRSAIDLGVKGFRLANAKHFIINRNVPESGAAYDQWERNGTVYQKGLGDLLHEFWQVVHNGTKGEGFLSVTDPIENIDAFRTSSGSIGFDLPLLNILPTTNDGRVAQELYKQLNWTVHTFGQNEWIQWSYNGEALKANNISPSEYNVFLFLLPGVPVGTLNEFESNNNTEEIEALEAIRKTQSYQHGSFAIYLDNEHDVVAYSR